MNKAIILVGLFILAVVIYLRYYAISSPYVISPDAAKALIAAQKADVILDVRTDAERYVAGDYPGSVHIPTSDLTTVMPQRFPKKEITIIVYCNTGQRARKATEILHSLGYKNARYITSTYWSLIY